MPALLWNRSAFSLQESILRPRELAEFAKQQGFDTVCLTDHNVMHGQMAFFSLCRKYGLRILYGIELDVVRNDTKVSYLVYATSVTGYVAMMKLSSRISDTHQPLPFDDFITMCTDCRIVLPLSNCVFTDLLLKGQQEESFSLLNELTETIPNLSVMCGPVRSRLWDIANEKTVEYCHLHGIPFLIGNLATYPTAEHQQSFQILQAILQDKTLNDPALKVPNNQHLLTMEEYCFLPERMQKDTEKFVTECYFDMDFPSTSLPVYPSSQGVDNNEYLKSLCIAGLQKRRNNKPIPTEYKTRLLQELQVIQSMGFSDYFLIVWDFILFARKNNIYVGPGRGSAAGSLVAYCLGITHVDPIRYNLLFERFLNPQRITMPDIDVDFPDNKRDDVIAYVIRKYGEEHVCRIITFGTFGAKQVLRDVGKVLSVQTRMIDALIKTIPNDPKITLKEAYTQSKNFRELVHSDPVYVKLLQQAQPLEGLPRHRSVHAGGVVLSGKPLHDVVPLIRMDTNTVATQYSKDYIEPLGLIKMDFLSLRNLTTIDEIVQEIQLHTPLDILKIPLNDPKTYTLLSNADTVGVFQLETEGMKELLRKLKPQTFDEIAACLALYRPGPMENIPVYLKNRQNPSGITYPHEDLKPILQETYGVIVYQEQIMQISQKMAGFSLAKADILRKAMSKKDESILTGLKEEFIAGCIANKYDSKIAHSIYDLILKFADYGFNKSHSIVYSLVAYQMAYLKANFPLTFYRSLLNSAIGREDKLQDYIQEIKQKNIKVYPPDIMKSTNQFEITDDGLLIPLSCIKGVGATVCKTVLGTRSLHPFTDYIDTVVYLQNNKMNTGLIETAISAGAFDCFNLSRTTMKENIAKILQYAQLVKVEDNGQSAFDFGLVPKPALTTYADSSVDNMNKQYDALGFYPGQHPIEYVKKIHDIHAMTIKYAANTRGEVSVFVQISKIKEHRTKKGEIMCFAVGVDETGSMDFAIMPNTYNRYRTILYKGNYLLINGKIEDRNSCLAQNMIEYKLK
ncbi:MAG: DNA polymerase III subunit alpha [Erysipelotrichaceae bacterium]|nr:DNA polymerase III subunit alpha [Erysipelotrichaceae bacterium]